MRHLGSATVSSIIIGLLLAAGAYILVRHLRKQTTLSWIEYIAKMTEHQNSGILTGMDKTGIPLTFEWKKIEVRDHEFIEKSRELSDAYAQAVEPFVVEFLKEHPEILASEPLYKPLKPLFEKGVDPVDWKRVEKEMLAISRSDFVRQAADFDKKDISWFVVAKDKTGILGFVQFLARHDDPWGAIRIANLMLLPAAQHRGIGKVLASSVFKLFPPEVHIKFITLSVMNANKQAIAAYTSYGFIGKAINQDVSGSFSMGYVTDQSDILQKEAEKLK